jgi:hypothetical protein
MADKCGDLGKQALDSEHMSALMPLLVYTCKCLKQGKIYVKVLFCHRKRKKERGRIKKRD